MSPINAVIIVYVFISIPIFFLVYKSSNLVVDEEFHVRQGQHYCNGKFHVVSLRRKKISIVCLINFSLTLQWDNKITTFPGLYILSSIFLLPLNICSTFALRLISLFSSVINVLLIFEIRRVFQQKVLNKLRFINKLKVLNKLRCINLGKFNKNCIRSVYAGNTSTNVFICSSLLHGHCIHHNGFRNVSF